MEDMNGMLKIKYANIAEGLAARSQDSTHHHPSVILRDSKLAGKLGESKTR